MTSFPANPAPPPPISFQSLKLGLGPAPSSSYVEQQQETQADRSRSAHGEGLLQHQQGVDGTWGEREENMLGKSGDGPRKGQSHSFTNSPKHRAPKGSPLALNRSHYTSESTDLMRWMGAIHTSKSYGLRHSADSGRVQHPDSGAEGFLWGIIFELHRC